MYSVFLVEDEIVAREGIRKRIPWDTTPYTLAGEAPDGEIALPALREIKPDILITDIKMPFMDGLALSRIIKKDQPWMKIIILSGHDEFQYAQEAISIGVEEYLLKPVSSKDMLASLEKVRVRIEEEKERIASMENLRRKVRSAEEVYREKWLLDLVTGQSCTVNALEEAQGLGINLLPGGYSVLIVDVPVDPKHYSLRGRVKEVIAALIKGREDLFMLSQGAERHIILLKNISPATYDEAVYPLAQAIKFEVERNTGCYPAIGIGPAADHLTEIIHSYTSAARVLRCMAVTGEKNILTSADFVGSDTDSVMRTKRNSVIQKAKRFIDANYMRPDLSLNSVASSVNMSPNHFSTVFSQEAGKTFIEYLTCVRIDKAKKLLLKSDMKCSDITFEAGFSDPHYFSFIFKKNTGLSPREYRLETVCADKT